jgi:membrane-bound inhibitor of C-type lysozyme
MLRCPRQSNVTFVKGVVDPETVVLPEVDARVGAQYRPSEWHLGWRDGGQYSRNDPDLGC